MRTQLHQIVADSAARRGEAPALTFKDTTVGYTEMWAGITAFAASRSQRRASCQGEFVESGVVVEPVIAEPSGTTER